MSLSPLAPTVHASQPVIAVSDPSDSLSWRDAKDMLNANGGAILIFCIALTLWVTRSKRFGRFFDGMIELISQLKLNIASLTEANLRNTEANLQNQATLSKMAENDANVAKTLERQQASIDQQQTSIDRQQKTLDQIVVDSPRMLEKQDEQIERLTQNSIILRYNSLVLQALARQLQCDLPLSRLNDEQNVKFHKQFE